MTWSSAWWRPTRSWCAGTPKALTRVTAGEIPLHLFTNYHSCRSAAELSQGNLECDLIDPVPVRLSNALGVLNEDVANNPYGALLFIEWMAGPGGQAILDKDPLKSSIHAERSDVKDAIGDFSTSGGSIEDYLSMDGWMENIGEFLGPS